MNDYGGLFRGFVQATDDPEQRKRCRVRVIGVHRDDVPVEALPWAEWCGFGGKGFGDFPSLEVGDPVFVMFDQGDRRFPVILGGWLSYQGGTNDLPNEVLGDYAKNQQRWVRLDRAGNKITMSPLPEELFVEIQSGDAKLTVRGLDGSFEIQTDARTTVRSPQVQVLDATEVTVETQRLVAQVAEEATLQCDAIVNLQGAQQINIGKYQPPVTSGPALPKTTDEVNVDADQLVHAQSGAAVEFIAGTTISLDAQGNITLHTIANVIIEGEARVEVNSDGPVAITASALNVAAGTAKVVIDSQTDTEIVSGGRVLVQAATSVDVEAQGSANVTAAADVAVSAGGNATVTCQGNATVNATGFISLNSPSKIELLAPVIEIEASSLLSLIGTGTVTIDGGTILVG